MERVAKALRRLTNELEPFIAKEKLQFITELLEAAEYGVVFGADPGASAANTTFPSATNFEKKPSFAATRCG
jgi:hypothetical protein